MFSRRGLGQRAGIIRDARCCCVGLVALVGTLPVGSACPCPCALVPLCPCFACHCLRFRLLVPSSPLFVSFSSTTTSFSIHNFKFVAALLKLGQRLLLDLRFNSTHESTILSPFSWSMLVALPSI